MRYFGSPTISFTDVDGNEFELIEPQDIQEASEDLIQLSQIGISDGDELDLIAQKTEIYGDENEDLWFRIFDFNLVDIVENNYLINGLKVLNIPRA